MTPQFSQLELQQAQALQRALRHPKRLTDRLPSPPRGNPPTSAGQAVIRRFTALDEKIMSTGSNAERKALAERNGWTLQQLRLYWREHCQESRSSLNGVPNPQTPTLGEWNRRRVDLGICYHIHLPGHGLIVVSQARLDQIGIKIPLTPDLTRPNGSRTEPLVPNNGMQGHIAAALHLVQILSQLPKQKPAHEGG